MRPSGMMGMLWRMENQGAPADRVSLALAYYQKKYGKQPKFVYGKPEFLATVTEIPGVTMMPLSVVQDGHIVVCVAKEEYEGKYDYALFTHDN